jgi:hypothetical protein
MSVKFKNNNSKEKNRWERVKDVDPCFNFSGFFPQNHLGNRETIQWSWGWGWSKST